MLPNDHALILPDGHSQSRGWKGPTYVLRAAEGDASDARDAGEVELLEGLAGLLLVAVVDYGSRASGKLALADILIIGDIVGLLDGRLLEGLVVGKLFDSGVGHFG